MGLVGGARGEGDGRLVSRWRDLRRSIGLRDRADSVGCQNGSNSFDNFLT